jgi:LPXTG-site transpeptidase (sortase) family protein
MKKITAALLITAFMCLCTATDVLAADYRFTAKNNDDFYKPTLYEDVYGSIYNYGGPNVIDFADTSRLPGIPAPVSSSGSTSVPVANSSYVYSAGSADVPVYGAISEMPYTPINGLVRADGSIGTLSIPSLSISVKVYEGTTAESLGKGAGHFSDSSAWLGNVCVAGHNRGAKYNIGSIKNLKPGDTVIYETALGTRRYAVTFSGTIAGTDMSYLSATRNNRITIITCLADQPSLRVCVQATEI